ncbi:serine/threonine protein kinase [Massilia sp. W12]|uniref:serine/threonine protein kinase n=1 Tax=Massilia sp. W12 TaxID=3126507 RepID=UPI0030D3D101
MSLSHTTEANQLGQGFAGLSPERVLDALAARGLAVDGRLLALNSYENRVYQVGIEDGAPIIAKFYRAHRWSDAAILEEHAFLQELFEAEVPSVPALTVDGQTLLHDGDLRFALFRRQGGRAPELFDPEVLRWLGRFMGRIHMIGARQPFAARERISIAALGEASGRFLLEHDFLPPALRPAWRAAWEQALEAVHAAFARAGDYPEIRLHGDCHLGNVLWTDSGPHFVDFDDARNGPAIQDLWMLLSGDRAEMTQQLCDILEGYEDFAEFDPSQLHLIEALRCLRLIHYSAWLARRWTDPAFPPAFPWFGTERYWQEKIIELREQIALLSEAPLRV